MNIKSLLYSLAALVLLTIATYFLVRNSASTSAKSSNPSAETSGAFPKPSPSNDVVTKDDTIASALIHEPSEHQEREIPSDDPLTVRYANEKGEITRVVRKNPQGLVLSEVRYLEGQESKVEKVFSPYGKLLRTQRFQNGLMIKNEEFR